MIFCVYFYIRLFDAYLSDLDQQFRRGVVSCLEKLSGWLFSLFWLIYCYIHTYCGTATLQSEHTESIRVTSGVMPRSQKRHPHHPSTHAF